MSIPRSFGTHDGTFHADEVTACALLLCHGLIDLDKVQRSRKKEVLDSCEFVCDVGGEYDARRKKFDHHQLSYTGDFSSAGMVWAYLLEQNIVTKSLYNFLNHSLLHGVDAHDNGRVTLYSGVCTFSQVISNFVPIRYDCSSEDQNKAFFAAVDFVVGHLNRLMMRFAYTQECREKVQEEMAEKKDYLVFEESMPWIDAFFELEGERHPARFVVMPSSGHWKLRGIPPNDADRMKVREPLPERWAGLLEEELKEVTGIPGAVFCHKGRFISVWETKEAVMEALAYVLKEK